MSKQQNVVGIEINPKFVGALFTEQVDNTLRVFCFYLSGEVAKFDLPAKENLDSLHHFFSALNMEETCSSVVIDEVVQGRYYVRSEDNYWLYTLLASPGSVLPTYNADICNLPWHLFWRSQEADILEYGKTGDPGHCYAIRTAITEGDATRLLKESKGFINPALTRKKRSPGRLFLGIGVGLACLVLPIALTMFYAFKPNANASTEPAPAVVVKAAAQAPAAGSFYLLSNHRISGPYSAKTIATMKAGGQLAADTMCRAENSTDWAGINTLFPSVASK